MPSLSLRARPPSGDSSPAPIVADGDLIAAHLEDAAHFPGGHATELAVPSSEAQIAGLVRRSSAVLPIGAQSSLTGGATPMGETLVSTARLNRIESLGSDRVRLQTGVTIAELDHELEHASRCYPPAPTFFGPTIGGIVSTNAAGAATFKYGATRNWVEALTVVLPSGDVLDVERGATRACDGHLDLELAGRTVRIDVPGWRHDRAVRAL